MKTEDILSTSEDFFSEVEDVKLGSRRERYKRKKLSSGGSTDMTCLNELKEEVGGLKDFLTKIDGKLEGLAELKEDIARVARNVEKIWQKVEHMEQRCDKMEEKVSLIEKKNEKTQEVLEMLEERSIDQEARSRRNNLMFYGVREEKDEEGREDCATRIKKVLRESCNIDQVVIERAHRTGRSSTGNPRPIIVKFLDFNAKMRVKKEKRRLPQEIRVGDDLPIAVREAQKQLYAECKAARDDKKDAFIAYPARLVVDGREIRSVKPTLVRPGHQHGAVSDRQSDSANNSNLNQPDSDDTRRTAQSEWQTAGSRRYSGGAWRGRGNNAKGGRGAIGTRGGR